MLTVYKKIILIVFIMAVCWSKTGAAQDSPDGKFTISQLQSDYTYFRTLLEKTHSSLYRYVSKDSMDHYFDDGLAKITKPMSELEFWKLLQPTVVKIGSGHTTVYFSDYTNNVYNNGTHLYLPFYVSIRNNKLFIRDFYTITNLSYDIGDEIISIDGISSEKIVNNLREYIPGDGYSNSFRDNVLEGISFMHFFGLMYGEKEKYYIVFNTANGLINKVMTSTKAVIRTGVGPSGHGIFANNEEKAGLKINRPDSFYRHVTYPPDIPSTAIVKIDQFAYQDYSSFHSRLFKQLKKSKTQNLIIDLRNNGGGFTKICLDLLPYLSDKETQFISISEGAVDYKKFLFLKALYNPLDLSQLDRQVFQKKVVDCVLQKPEPNHFKGKLYVLVNGGSYSAAALFAVALKNQVDCTIIGQETGGGKYGTDGDIITVVCLPETHLQVRLPLLWCNSMAKGKNEGYGLEPDIEIVPDAKQIYDQAMYKIDPIMLKVKQLIGQNKSD